MTTVVATTTTAFVEITETSGAFTLVQAPGATATVEIVTAGPQGPSGIQAGALPTGGDTGSVLMKNTNANYDSSWIATLDGGTFN